MCLMTSYYQQGSSTSHADIPRTTFNNTPSAQALHVRTLPGNPIDTRLSTSFLPPSLSRQSSTEDVPEGETSRSVSIDISRPGSSFGPFADSSNDGQTHERRGRKNSRFSLSAVSNVLRDAMYHPAGSRSPHTASMRDSTNSSRSAEIDRGMTSDKRKARQISKLRPKERFSIGKLGELLKKDGDEELGNGWKEFKPGSMQ
jgi:hypothetical protein